MAFFECASLLARVLKTGLATIREENYFLNLTILINKAGNKTRLVKVAVMSVKEVSHPKAFVPPNPLKQKITNPAINTSEV